jgi:hypothetical protein
MESSCPWWAVRTLISSGPISGVRPNTAGTLLALVIAYLYGVAIGYLKIDARTAFVTAIVTPVVLVSLPSWEGIQRTAGNWLGRRLPWRSR